MPNPNDFAGRGAVVTGGSDGLGFDFCRALCESGATVYFCARNAERGLEAQKRLGENAHFVAADVSNPDDIQRFADEVSRMAGAVDYLINNVAVDDRIPFDDLNAELADQIWQINLRSYLLTSRAFLGAIRAGAGKAIVNIGTTNYHLGLELFTLYNATKSGIVGFTRSLARELGRDGVRVNMVSPGWIMTEKQLREHVTPADQADLLRDQCLKFLLEPKHVTPSVLFLLSSEAAGITGQELMVDGGKVMA